MSMQTLEDVLYHALKDLLSAEKQFRDALPKLAEAAEDSDLASAFREHQQETIEQIDRLEQCFKHIDRAVRSEKCEAADGLVTEGEDVIEEDGEALAKDVMLAAAGRKTEFYEIVSYRDAASLAEQLGFSKAASLLKTTLQEEEAAAEKLHQISQRLAESAS